MSVTLFNSKEATMSSSQISNLVGSRHDTVKKSMERLAEKELISITPMTEPTQGGGKALTTYHVNERDSYIVVAQLSPEFTAVLVDEWQRLKNLAPSLPNFNNPADAARAWAIEYEAKQAALVQLDYAIATKAEIGQRREATAMNTASQAVKRANKLEKELDQSKQWSTIKRMEILTGLKFNWKLLSDASNDLGHEREYVHDTNYGKVRTYHADAWLEAYALDINQ